jgi:hypothetical protein
MVVANARLLVYHATPEVSLRKKISPAQGFHIADS